MLVSRMNVSTGGREPPKLEGANERRRGQGIRNSTDVNLDLPQIPQNKVWGTTEGQVEDSGKKWGTRDGQDIGRTCSVWSHRGQSRKGLQEETKERTRGIREDNHERWGAGWDAGLTQWPQVWSECGYVFPVQLFHISYTLNNLDLSVSFCQPLFSKTGIAKNNKTLTLRAVNLQEIIEMCLTLDLHNQEFLKCLNRFIIILLGLNKVFWVNFYGRCHIKINWFEMAEALKDYNRLIKWVTSFHVWHHAQRKRVKK